MTDIIYDFVTSKKAVGLSWKAIAKLCNAKFGSELTANSIKKRFYRAEKSKNIKITKKHDDFSENTEISDEKDFHEYEKHSQSKIELHKKAFFEKDVQKTPDNILIALGYDPKDWVLEQWKLSNWDVPCKNQDKDCFCIKATINAKTQADMTPSDYCELAKEVFSEIRDFSPKNTENTHKNYKNNAFSDKNTGKLLEIPPIELHLGKVAHKVSSGDIYNSQVAENTFNTIMDNVARIQEMEKASECLIVIGSDFFNAEASNTTTRGTPQQNDLNYKEMFMMGLRMYRDAIFDLQTRFDRVNVMLCAGNHARATEFYMFCALNEYFYNFDNVSFDMENIRDTVSFQWGDCAIFFNHGDVNLKRILKSIPAEFPNVWGCSRFRELHMGHLHCETAEEDGGMTARRIGSPCGTDDWCYQERFIGAVKKHQVFVWNVGSGLQSIHYINV